MVYHIQRSLNHVFIGSQVNTSNSKFYFTSQTSLLLPEQGFPSEGLLSLGVETTLCNRIIFCIFSEALTFPLHPKNVPLGQAEQVLLASFTNAGCGSMTHYTLTITLLSGWGLRPKPSPLVPLVLFLPTVRRNDYK